MTTELVAATGCTQLQAPHRGAAVTAGPAAPPPSRSQALAARQQMKVLEGEAEAIRADATRRLAEARAVERELLRLPADDPAVRRELRDARSWIRSAEAALREYAEAA